jgi:hypothetical protein
MRGFMLFVILAGCGGIVESTPGIEESLDKKKKDACNGAAQPVCTTPRKYALLFRGRPKPTNFSNDESGEDANDMADNVTEMARALGARGFEVSTTDSYAGFEQAVARLAKRVRCCDEVLVYYTGHGSRRAGDPRKDYGYLVDGQMHYLVADSQHSTSSVRYAAKNMDARALALQLSRLKTCHLHVVIDACYSGGFAEPLLSTLPGLETIQTSAGSTEKAWSGAIDSASALGADGKPVSPARTVNDPWGRAAGEKGSEFSSGFVRGIDRAPADTNLEGLAQAGFGGALADDVTAQAGWTHPVNRSRVGDCICLEDGSPWIPVCAPPYNPEDPSTRPPSEEQPR